MWRIGYIAESVAALIIFKDNLLVGNAVEGYIRYIALNTLFYHPAKRFSDFSDFQIPSNKLAEYFTLINIVAYSLQSSVLYHEFGHHILSHTTKKTTTSAASQKLEIEADKWSVRTMLKNDIIPMMAIYNFFILREYNLNELSNEKTSSHPATIKRMFTFIESTRSSLIDPQVVARINANQPKTGKSVEEIKQKLEQIIYMFENFLNKQKYKASNPVEYAVEYMQQNSRQATLQLADYYSKGKHGIKKNLRKAQELYCQAANSKQIDFDYVGIAQANFMCGYSYWFVSILDKDYEKAKYYLTKSSDMDYSHAVYNLKRLKKSKKK